MNKLNIAIFFGGKTAEYEVSLQSAYAVIQSIDTTKYTPVLIGITRSGDWYRFYGDIECIPADTWHNAIHCAPAFISPSPGHRGLVELHDGQPSITPLDAAFPVMHGTFGEDGTLQGLLELAGIPIVGCGTLSSALCMDKAMAHTVVEAAGVAVPRSYVFTQDISKEAILKAASLLKYPLFVKPVRAGSSFGITKVNSEIQLFNAIEKAFAHDTKILLEEAIEGFEVGCAIMGNHQLTAGLLDEIELTEGFFDYTEKYNLVTSKIHVPARVDTKTAARIMETAITIYRALDCRVFARVDMFLTPNRRIVFNEVNTIPGFTSHSRYPTMMKHVGIGFTQLLSELVQLAVGHGK